MVFIIIPTANLFNLLLLLLFISILVIGSSSLPTTSPTTYVQDIDGNNNNNNENSPFKIIFDGGSTGSRLHIFEFVEIVNDVNGEDCDSDGDGDEKNNTRRCNTTDIKYRHDNNLTTMARNHNNNNNNIQCIRRGSSRANIPLSAFGRLPSEQQANNPFINSTEVAAHLLPLFEYAANVIPSQYHRSTGISYSATAGMRLLNESEQDAVYDALYKGLMDDESFVFRSMERNDISTLSGPMEAYFGALSANYILGIIDSELQILSSVPNNEGTNHHHRHPVGALDMGGSSTQIVYLRSNKRKDINSPSANSGTCPITLPHQNESDNNVVRDNTCRLNDGHFFSTSYLSYGVDQFRERLWQTLVTNYIESIQQEHNIDSHCETCNASVVSNPCANKGYKVEYNGHTLVGTGNTEECIRQTKKLIPHQEISQADSLNNEDDETIKNIVGGVEHPPIQGKFLAMSLYFFSLDSLRVFSAPDKEAHTALNRSWPNPSIDELYRALDGLCSRDWYGDMALQEGVHPFTRAEVLPHRCLESVYMVTLLKDGFGFHPSSRDITFTFLVDGDEVEWTLGMAIAMNAQEGIINRRHKINNNNYDDDYESGHNQSKYNGEERSENKMNSTVENDNEGRFQIQEVPYGFGVTLPPTHCC